MAQIHDDIKHQLKVIAIGRSMIKKAEERLGKLLEALVAHDAGKPPAEPEPSSLSPEREEELRQRVRRRLRELGYVPKYK
jgi:hypothetical protein